MAHGTARSSGSWSHYDVQTGVAPAQPMISFGVSYDGDPDATIDVLYDYLPGYDTAGEQVLLMPNPSDPDELEFCPQQLLLVVEGLPADAWGVTLSLDSVSQNGGFCSNATVSEISTQNGNDDFSFSPSSDTARQELRPFLWQDQNGKTWSSYYWGTGTVSPLVTGGKAVVPIYCKDFGAWADVRLTYFSGRHEFTEVLELPQRGSTVPKVWKDAVAAMWYLWYGAPPGEDDLKDMADSEPADPDGSGPIMPHGVAHTSAGTTGDGYLVWEEYRGFWIRTFDPEDPASSDVVWQHLQLNPIRKDLMVQVDAMNGILTRTELRAALDIATETFATSGGIDVHFAIDSLDLYQFVGGDFPHSYHSETIHDVTGRTSSRYMAKTRAPGHYPASRELFDMSRYVHVLFAGRYVNVVLDYADPEMKTRSVGGWASDMWNGAIIAVDACRDYTDRMEHFGIQVHQVLGSTLAHELGHCVGMEDAPLLDAVDAKAEGRWANLKVTDHYAYVLLAEDDMLPQKEFAVVGKIRLLDCQTISDLVDFINRFYPPCRFEIVDAAAGALSPYLLECRTPLAAEGPQGLPVYISKCTVDLTVMDTGNCVNRALNPRFACYASDRWYAYELACVDVGNNYGFR